MNTTITGQAPEKKEELKIDAATLLARREEYVERLRLNVPPEMRARRFWVLHHREKWPATAAGKHLKWKDKTTWLTFEQALQALMKAHPDVTGIGVVLPLSEGSEALPRPLTCMDLDDCLNEDGTPKDTPGLREILERFSSHYMETSPSGRGLHGWFIGPWLPGVTTQTLFKGQKVEVYERNHFVTVTGRPWTPPGGTPTKELLEAGKEVGWLNRSLKPEDVPAGKATDKTGADKEQPQQAPAEARRADAGATSGTVTPGSLDEVRRCLFALPPEWRDDYDPWVRAGMMVHDATGGSQDGLALWDEWSRGSGKYKGPEETVDKWKTFHLGGGVGIKSLRFHSGLYPDMAPPEGDFAEFIDPDWEPDGGTGTASDSATGTAGQAGVCPLPPGFSIVREGRNAGLWHTETNDDGDPIRTWICPPLEVLGVTRDMESKEWGLYLAWHDPDEIRHTWAMPDSILDGDPAEYHKRFSSEGLKGSKTNRARAKFKDFLTTVKPKARFRCVPRTGWHGNVYVFPDETIGEEPGGERTVLQTASPHNPFAQSGTLEEWQDSVAAPAQGNSRLMLTLCASFASALLHPCGQESGGFNFVGNSSTGKTTALIAASSVWGRGSRDGGYMKTWRATGNGLESVAALHSDGLLALDEIGQAPALVVKEASYLLANGTGRLRARQDGTARAAQSWRLLVLSTGEAGLAERIMEEGGAAKAGQLVRLLDIPADAGAGLGLFEDLHGMGDPAAFAAALQEAAGKYYGTAARAFIRKAQEQGLKMIEQDWRSYRDMALEDLTGPKADGQTKRAAERFLLCALAGEYAARWDILPWPQGAAYQAVVKCFQAWLDRRGGTGPAEHKAIIKETKLFIELHGDSRFVDWDAPDARTVINRAGIRYHPQSGWFVSVNRSKRLC